MEQKRHLLSPARRTRIALASAAWRRTATALVLLVLTTASAWAYNIIYNSYRGPGLSFTATYDGKTEVTLEEPPAPGGYRFGGWFDNAELTGDPVDIIPAGSTGDKEFWAKWIKVYKVRIPDDIPDTDGTTLFAISSGEGDEFPAGTKVNFEVHIATGKQMVLEDISVRRYGSLDPSNPSGIINLTKTDGESFSYFSTVNCSFTMPDGDVVIDYYCYRNNGAYAIEWSNELEDFIRAKVGSMYVKSANAGDEVTLEFDANQGKTPVSVTVTAADASNVEVTQADPDDPYVYTFTMPDQKVTVSAVLKWGIDLICMGSGGGTVTATVGGTEATTADAGDVVTLTVAPDADYVLQSFEVQTYNPSTGTTSDVTLNKVSDAQYTFTMPEGTVGVFYSFASTLQDINVYLTSNGGTVTTTVGGAEATTAKAGDEVTLTIVPEAGWALSYLSVKSRDLITYVSSDVTLNKVSDTQYTFTMPLAMVEVFASFAFVFADDANNSTIIAEKAGKRISNVMLQGRTLYKNGSWNTLYLPFDVTSISDSPLAGATLMELDVDGIYDTDKKTGFDPATGTLYLYFKEATSIITGTPYIIKWDSGENIVNPVFQGVEIKDGLIAIVMSSDGNVCFLGTYGPTGIYSANNDNLFVGAGNSLYWPESSDYKLNAFRAYFHVGDGSTPSPVRRTVVNIGDGTTSVRSMENGEWTMDNEAGVWFTIDGRHLVGAPAAKGIYIVNGKKVVVK